MLYLLKHIDLIFPNIEELIINIKILFGGINPYFINNFYKIYKYVVNLNKQKLKIIKFIINENIILLSYYDTEIIECLDILEKFEDKLILNSTIYVSNTDTRNIDLSKYKYIKPKIVECCWASSIIDFTKNNEFCLMLAKPYFIMLEYIMNKDKMINFYFHTYKNTIFKKLNGSTQCYLLKDDNQHLKNKFYIYYLHHIMLFPTYYELFKIRKAYKEIDKDVKKILRGIVNRNEKKYIKLSNKLANIYKINHNYIYYYLFYCNYFYFYEYKIDICKKMCKYEAIDEVDFIEYQICLKNHFVVVDTLKDIIKFKNVCGRKCKK